MFQNKLRRRRRRRSSIAVFTVCERQKKGNMAVEFDQSIDVSHIYEIIATKFWIVCRIRKMIQYVCFLCRVVLPQKHITKEKRIVITVEEIGFPSA
jgi:hypothetical protein